MDYPGIVLALPTGQTLPIDQATLSGKEGEAMQATINNGSAEHRAESLQETEVKTSQWPWALVAEIGFALLALAVLLWMVLR